MKKMRIVGILILLGLLTACSMDNRNNSSMNSTEMNHSNHRMDEEMGHETTANLKSSKGEHELTFPKVLKPDSLTDNAVVYTIKAQQGKKNF